MIVSRYDNYTGQETQNWLDFALDCEYISEETHHQLDLEYENIIGMLVNMQHYPEKWTF